MRIAFRPRLLLGALVMSLIASLSACETFYGSAQPNAPLVEDQGRAPGNLTGGL